MEPLEDLRQLLGHDADAGVGDGQFDPVAVGPQRDVDAADEDTARRQIREMCERLLANPVTEDYEIAEVTPS